MIHLRNISLTHTHARKHTHTHTHIKCADTAYLEVVSICCIQYNWYQILSRFPVVISYSRRIPGQDQNTWREISTWSKIRINTSEHHHLLMGTYKQNVYEGLTILLYGLLKWCINFKLTVFMCSYCCLGVMLLSLRSSFSVSLWFTAIQYIRWSMEDS